jgi:hypothetical protein
MLRNKDLPAGPRGAGLRLVRGGRLGAALLGVTVAGLMCTTGQALAAPTADPDSTGTTVANVDVGAAILLSGLSASFTLSGLPGESPEDIGAVTMNVLSNNASGYNVTVEPAGPDFVGTTGNDDVIPVGDVSVKETGQDTGSYQALTPGLPVTVYSQDTRSATPDGDPLSNDYAFTTPIPDVHNDVYSVTLDYVASTNP